MLLLLLITKTIWRGEVRTRDFVAYNEIMLITSLPLSGKYWYRVHTVNTRYRHNLVIGTKTRVYQLSPAKTSSLRALAHLDTGTQKNHFVPITSYDVIRNADVSGHWGGE